MLKASVDNLITPLMAVIIGKPDFSGLAFTINGRIFRYGLFINALITFLLVAAAVYFVEVAPMNKLAPRPSSARSASARSRTGRASAPSAARRKRRYARLIGERPPRPPGR
jgi:large-conductance mechanosensitive channel